MPVSVMINVPAHAVAGGNVYAVPLNLVAENSTI